jgi:hypothetical protein
VTVWLDASGKLTGPPLQPGQVTDRTITVAVLVPAVLALSPLTAWCGVTVLTSAKGFTLYWFALEQQRDVGHADQACSAWATRTIKRIT